MRNWGNLWILSDLSNNIHIYHPIYLNKVVEPPSGCFPHCLQRYKFWCLFYSLVISLWCPFGYVSLSSGFSFPTSASVLLHIYLLLFLLFSSIIQQAFVQYYQVSGTVRGMKTYKIIRSGSNTHRLRQTNKYKNI